MLLLAMCAASIGCVVDAGNDSSTASYEVDCRGVPCDWVIKEGTPRFGATWHKGDIGVDLSGDGRAVVEQRVVLFPLHTRQLDMLAAVLRDAGAQLHLELDFYAPGSASGATFWDRSPVFLVTRNVDVFELGVFTMHRQVLIPSEAAAVVVRIVKDGSGRAMIDEFTLGHD
jgi:hypothetical protein